MRRTRTEPRKVFLCRVTVDWEKHGTAIQSQSGLLEDRSRSGAGISVDNPIPVGANVKIRGRHRELAGVVRHCRREDMRYILGIQYREADVTWAKIRACI